MKPYVPKHNIIQTSARFVHSVPPEKAAATWFNEPQSPATVTTVATNLSSLIKKEEQLISVPPPFLNIIFTWIQQQHIMTQLRPTNELLIMKIKMFLPIHLSVPLRPCFQDSFY